VLKCLCCEDTAGYTWSWSCSLLFRRSSECGFADRFTVRSKKFANQCTVRVAERSTVNMRRISTEDENMLKLKLK